MEQPLGNKMDFLEERLIEIIVITFGALIIFLILVIGHRWVDNLFSMTDAEKRSRTCSHCGKINPSYKVWCKYCDKHIQPRDLQASSIFKQIPLFDINCPKCRRKIIGPDLVYDEFKKWRLNKLRHYCTHCGIELVEAFRSKIWTLINAIIVFGYLFSIAYFSLTDWPDWVGDFMLGLVILPILTFYFGVISLKYVAGKRRYVKGR